MADTVNETNIVLFRGNDAVLNFTHYSDPPTNSAAVNITGWTIVFNLSQDSNTLTKIITNRACTLLVPASGTYRAVLTAAELATLEPGDYRWDVTRTDSGAVTTLGHGRARVVGVPRLPSA